MTLGGACSMVLAIVTKNHTLNYLGVHKVVQRSDFKGCSPSKDLRVLHWILFLQTPEEQ